MPMEGELESLISGSFDKGYPKPVSKIECSGRVCIFYRRGVLHTPKCMVPI